MPKYLTSGLYDQVIVPYKDYLNIRHPGLKIVGREKEQKYLIQLLFMPSTNSVLLKGPAGVGKQSIINGLVLNQQSSSMPFEMMARPIYRLNVNVLFASSVPAHVETKIEEALRDLKKLYLRRSAKPLLVIDDGQNFVNNLVQGRHHNVVNLLLDADSVTNFIDMVLCINDEAFIKLNDAFPTFISSFAELPIECPDDDLLLSILSMRVEGYLDSKITVSREVLEHIKDTTTRYPSMYNFAQPWRALRLLDQCAISAQLEMHSKPEGSEDLENSLNSLEVDSDDYQQTEKQLQSITDQWQQKRSKITSVQNGIKEYESLIADTQEELASLVEKDQKKLNDIASKARADLIKAANSGEQATLAKGRPSGFFTNLSDAEILAFIELDTNLVKHAGISELEANIRGYEKGISKLSERQTALAEELSYPVDLSVESVDRLAAQITKLPIGGVGNSMEQILLDGEEKLNSVVFGQEKIVSPMVTALKQAAAGGNDENQPFGTFLLLGSSGVGKTYIAEMIAEIFFGGKEFITIVNMENYSEKHSVSSLIGASPGYAGYGDPGVLIKAAQEKPYSVILLDEIEKAHKNVHQALLTALDGGYIKGLDGQVGDLRNCIIIATSNYGQDLLLRDDMNFEDIVKEIDHRIYRDSDNFSPELLNRFSLLFASFLTPEVISMIIANFVKELEGRYQKKNPNFFIEIDKDSISNLVANHYRRAQGARVVKRLLANKVGGECSNIILSQRVKNGEAAGSLKVSCNSEGLFSTEFVSKDLKGDWLNGRKVILVENPPDYVIPGESQIPIAPKVCKQELVNNE